MDFFTTIGYCLASNFKVTDLIVDALAKIHGMAK